MHMGGSCSTPVTLVKNVEIVDVADGKVTVLLNGSRKDVFTRNAENYKKGGRVDVWIDDDEWQDPHSLMGEGSVGITRTGRYRASGEPCESQRRVGDVMQFLSHINIFVCLVITVAGVWNNEYMLPCVGACAYCLCLLFFKVLHPLLETFFAKYVTDEHIVSKVFSV